MRSKRSRATRELIRRLRTTVTLTLSIEPDVEIHRLLKALEDLDHAERTGDVQAMRLAINKFCRAFLRKLE